MAEKKSINLVISNNQYSEKLIPTGQTYKRVLILEDNIEVTTEGFLYNKGKSMYITYDEVADGGLENTKTILKLEGEDKLQIRRYGKDDGAGMMDMRLEEGVLNITRYIIPTGTRLMRMDLGRFLRIIRLRWSRTSISGTSLRLRLSLANA